MAFSGAVLAGGRSTRMGTDKAFVEVNGAPMVLHAHRALVEAGATDVVVVGGDAARLLALGLPSLADSTPGEGPLGAILDALDHAQTPVVVVLACDQPDVDAVLVRRLAAAVTDDADVAVPVVDGVPQPLAAAYARHARDVLRTAFTSGERSPSRALTALRWSALDDIDPRSVRDVDDPRDVARYAAERHSSPIARGDNPSG